MSAARKSAYDSTTHCASEAVAWRACWILGNATLTTVPSMKARLEPRIAAARTQPRCTAGPDAIAPVSECTESHGYFSWSLLPSDDQHMQRLVRCPVVIAGCNYRLRDFSAQ